jgi:hypothetical protein
MKQIILFSALFCLSVSLFGQKVSVKNGELSIDNKVVALIQAEKNKEMMGLVKDFTVTNPAGELLFIAEYSSEIPEDPNDNLYYYFKFTFPALEEVAWLPVNKMGAEKSVGNLVGKNGLIRDGAIDADALGKLVAKKGKVPEVKEDYTMATRNRAFPVEIREVGKIQQAGELISNYTDKGTIGGSDVYDFYLPSGVLAARVSFSGGNNAPTAVFETMKDKQKRSVNLNVQEKASFVAAIDRNYLTIKRIANWLVENKYI